jgi:cytochrome P450
MFILPIVLIGVILFIVVYWIYHRFCYFANRAIPSPPISSIIFGHLTDLWSAKSYSEQLRQWTHQYGSVYGLFEGTRPVYVISDIKFMEEIFITQFARFYSRRTSLANRILGEEHFNVLSANVAQLWKKQRKILNPTFSGAKMKRLLPTVETCVNIFIGILSSIPHDAIINIYEIYKRLTMDVICKYLKLRSNSYGGLFLNRSMCI